MDITKFVTGYRERAFLLGSYDTYRAQLSRRLLTVRKKLGRATPKNAKYAAKAPVTAEDIGKNTEFLHLLLLTAERAWAHAMLMKAAHSEDNADQNITGSTRQHILSRLHKAVQCAEEVVALVSDQAASGATDTDVLEAKAYAYSLAGTEAFEKQAEGVKDSDASSERWQPCLTNFAAARVIYNALLRTTRSELFKEVLVTAIDPSIRYAAYQNRIPRTVGVPAVAQRFFPKDDAELVQAVEKLDSSALREEKPSASGTTITWRNRKANIVDAAIGQALVSIESESLELANTVDLADSTKDKAAAYDDVLISCQDAADATRQAIEELEKEGVDEGDARMQDLRVTSLAVNYDLVAWRIGRYRVLISDDDGLTFSLNSNKPRRQRKDGQEWVEREEPTGRKLARLRERVALYDAILQSIDSIEELRGAMRDTAFIAELDGQRAYFQALKCLNLSRSHAFLGGSKEALALVNRAASLSAQANSAPKPPASSTGNAPKLAVSDHQSQHLQITLKQLTSHYRGLVTLSQIMGNANVEDKAQSPSVAPLVERLNDYPASGTVDLTNLVTWPPRLKPIPVKPLFFDVAFNYIDYPGRAGHVTQSQPEKMQVDERTEEQKQQKKGWFGFGR